MDGWLCVDCVAFIEHPAMFVNGFDRNGEERRAENLATVLRFDMGELTDAHGNRVALYAATLLSGDALCGPHVVIRLAARTQPHTFLWQPR